MGSVILPDLAEAHDPYARKTGLRKGVAISARVIPGSAELVRADPTTALKKEPPCVRPNRPLQGRKTMILRNALLSFACGSTLLGTVATLAPVEGSPALSVR
jgi:hypothetical protein